MLAICQRCSFGLVKAKKYNKGSEGCIVIIRWCGWMYWSLGVVIRLQLKDFVWNPGFPFPLTIAPNNNKNLIWRINGWLKFDIFLLFFSSLCVYQNRWHSYLHYWTHNVTHIHSYLTIYIFFRNLSSTPIQFSISRSHSQQKWHLSMC